MCDYYYAMTEETTTPADSKVKLCHVCREAIDKFKGLHYGGQTCYSCRAFFRRCHSADRKHPFEASCKSDGKCEVSSKTRRKCPKCRHVRCLQIGMRPELVLTQEEKKARFRKYYEKKAGMSGGDSSGMTPPDAAMMSSSSEGRSRSNQRSGSMQRSSEGDSGEDSENKDIADEDGERILEDPNLLQLCMDEVDKILRENVALPSFEGDYRLVQGQNASALVSAGSMGSMGSMGPVGSVGTFVTLQPNEQNFWNDAHMSGEKYILERL